MDPETIPIAAAASAAPSGRAKRTAAGRARILHAAAQEFHLKGFQGAGLNDILAITGLTKGALYYHFPTKNALGYAVITEIVQAWIRDVWIAPLERAAPAQAIDGIIGILRASRSLEDEERLARGCMLLNLSQEMAPLDPEFRTRTRAVFDAWRGALSRLLRSGQQAGAVRAGLNPDAAAAFIVASHEGALSLAKNAANSETLTVCHGELEAYLESLRTPPPETATA